MDTGREASIKAKRAEVADAVTAKVNALPNLSETQRARVLDVCLAHVVNHGGAEPNYEGVAAHTRSIIS
jgi:hypothetical protein